MIKIGKINMKGMAEWCGSMVVFFSTLHPHFKMVPEGVHWGK